MKDEYINIKDIAEAKGLKSTRSLRLEINKPESRYVSREVKVNGGTSYEILFSSLEPELQDKLRQCETKSTALVPLNYQPPVVTDKARLTANHRINIVKSALEYRKKYKTQKEADYEFLDLYNTGLYLPKAYEFLGSISIGTLRRYIQAYKKSENIESLIPQYKISKQGEYNGILDGEMKKILLTLLLHQNRFNFNKAIKLTKEILIRNGYKREELPCDLTFKRFAEHFRDNNYAEWTLKRDGIKAYHDKVEPYIERDISKIEVGDVLIADGHVLNFQVIKPFTGKSTRATLVGFLDWKSTALVGYEIMMTENTQCIASAYHNSKPCPNNPSKSIQEMLDSVQKQDINKSALDYLMMKTEGRTINKHGITFLNMHYRSEAILGLRDKIYIRYSLFDLSKVYVYSAKGEFLCVAHRVQKVHPMARVLGTVKDMEEYNQQYKKQQQIKNRLIKKVKEIYKSEDIPLLEIKPEVIDAIAPVLEEKPKRERKKTPREQQMMRPIFANDAEKYEWLIAHGCTNQEDRQFLTKFIQSEQYQLLYGD